MQRVVEIRILPITHALKRLSSGIFAINKSIRDIHMPFRKGFTNRVEPSINASFARVNLLTAPDKAHNNRPIFVPIHTRDQELWLGMRKVRSLFLPLHEVYRLLQIPCALRLIKYYDVLNWRAGVY